MTTLNLAIGSPVRRRRVPIGRSIAYVLAALWTTLTLFPLIWMYYTSVKTLPDFTAHRWLPSTHVAYRNYVDAWSGNTSSRPGGVSLPFSSYFKNSVIVTSASVGISMTLATFAAYALARRRVLGRRLIWLALIVGLAVPVHALVLPTWALEDRYGLSNSYIGLILPYVGTSLPFAILLLAAYFESFPNEIEEAARIDGCSEFQLLRRIVLPMSRGPIAAVTILLANGFWNEFLYALVLMPDNAKKTLPVGVFNFSAEHFTPYNLVLAALGIVVTPILIFYIVFQRQISNANVEIVRG